MTEPTEAPPVAGETTAVPYVSRCIVCGKPGDQHPDGRWCGSEQYVTGDWTDIPIVADVARAIGSAFHRGDDAWTTEALAAIAAARPHLTAERDAETTALRAERDALLARDAAWKAYTADLSQLITSIGFDAWRGVDKGHDVLDDIYQATVVPPLPAVLADPAPSTPAAQETPDA